MRLILSLILSAAWTAAVGADIKVLSAGAVEPGIVKLAEQFRRDTGNRVRIQFGTAPQLEKRLDGDEMADVLIAPPGVMEAQVRRNKVDAESRFIVGRVGVGVVVRAGAMEPDIASLDRFKQSVLTAESIVYNQASTGLYLEKLFDLLGIGDQLKPKTTRYANGAQVLEHVIAGRGNEIGFGAITEIRLFEPKGLKYVGPLPAQVQNYTSYAVGVMTDAPSPDVAREFVRFLGTPAAKAVFTSAGIDPPAEPSAAPR
jgi:molybdate transport system substrate-binding protein